MFRLFKIVASGLVEVCVFKLDVHRCSNPKSRHFKRETILNSLKLYQRHVKQGCQLFAA